VNEKEHIILCVKYHEHAKNIVSECIDDGFPLGVYGARSRDLFLKIYPEYKYYSFVSI
jgi:hypothetical protein